MSTLAERNLKVITFECPAHIAREARIVAARLDISRSELMRRALFHELNRLYEQKELALEWTPQR